MKYTGLEMLCAYLLGIIVMSVGTYLLKPDYIVIERSSDSEWIHSKENYRDTVITHIKVINGITVYPTTEYKRIKL